MPELPEIMNLAEQMNTHLPGKEIVSLDVLQPKCLNLPEDAFVAALQGAQIVGASARGKWIVTETTRGWLLINLGMGGEVLLVDRQSLPEKYRLVMDFTDATCLAVNFWWFGHVHYAAAGYTDHPMVGSLGPDALSVDAEQLRQALAGRRGTIKSFLLDQHNIAGIGNSYIHDILFHARLHPLRALNSLSQPEIHGLVQAVQTDLRRSYQLGGAAYEMDLFGNKGGFTADLIEVGYREGQPCPRCGTAIEKIKTGSTTGYLCPVCQPL